MAEKLDNTALTTMLPGTRRWLWGDRQRVSKVLGTVGATGVHSLVLATGPRPLALQGLLIASAASRTAADTAINALIQAVEDLCDAGTEIHWEDDMGHSGAHLVLTGLRMIGPRTYSADGKQAWQRYVLAGRENYGDLS
ncbi:MAG TPA: hypothetical protein VMZ50_03845 [Phycisphaerae bacterium]|nr:hypothetical protein [Phycisphaerae bacterium]